MNQITGLQEMRFLAQSGSDAARLAALARDVGVLPEGADPDVAEWESCLLDLRKALSGPRISAELKCPACGQGVSLIFGVDDLPRSSEPLETVIAGKTMRHLRLSDLEAVEMDPGDRLERLLGLATGQDADWARAVLTGANGATAVAALEQSLSGLDLQLGTQCTECGTEIVSPFDVQAFVLAEQNRSASNLLEEIHIIARVYHWTEQEILALPRDRRRAYLGKIERDALKIEASDVGY